MKYEIVFEYFDDIVNENCEIVDRVVRNDFTTAEAKDIFEAKIHFYKYCTGIIRSITPLLKSVKND